MAICLRLSPLSEGWMHLRVIENARLCHGFDLSSTPAPLPGELRFRWNGKNFQFLNRPTRWSSAVFVIVAIKGLIYFSFTAVSFLQGKGKAKAHRWFFLSKPISFEATHCRRWSFDGGKRVVLNWRKKLTRAGKIDSIGDWYRLIPINFLLNTKLKQFSYATDGVSSFRFYFFIDN